MRDFRPVSDVVSAPTIDQIDAAGTPSLVGFWKLYDAVGDTFPDSSGNGLDMTIHYGYDGFSFQSVAQMLAYKSGWATFKLLDGALVDVVGTPLDTQDKVICVAAEEYYDMAAGVLPGYGFTGQDTDFGTSHDIGSTNDDYQGFMVGGAAGQEYFRVTHYDGATMNQFRDQVAVPAATEFVIAGAFVPGTALYSSINRGSVATVTTAVDSGNSISSATSLVAQDGKFGVLSGHLPTSIRNYQVWAWDAADAPSADELKMTIEWMNYNPGRIPPWWVGR